MTGRPLSLQAQQAFDLIQRAAASGAVAPSNTQIAAAAGSPSNGAGASLVKRLETVGLISVERFTLGRVMTILATGQSTAPVFGGYWRGPAVRAAVINQVRIAPDIDRAPPRGAPCARCGARPDTGCGHTASRLIGSMPARAIFA